MDNMPWLTLLMVVPLVGAVVVGGDTVGCDRVVVSVTALGDLAGRPPVTRTGGQPGDDVVLAGASARFTLAYTRIGLSPDGGSTLLGELLTDSPAVVLEAVRD